MTLPTKIKQRKGHSAVAFGAGRDYRVVVLFGGFDVKSDAEALSETTLLLLCESPPSSYIDNCPPCSL